jgi:alpha-galactosidase
MIFTLISLALNLDNGLALTPFLGWSSEVAFGCDVDETKIKKQADLLVSTGLAAKGYRYIILDGCWQVKYHLFRAQETLVRKRLLKIITNFLVDLIIWLTIYIQKVSSLGFQQI